MGDSMLSGHVQYSFYVCWSRSATPYSTYMLYIYMLYIYIYITCTPICLYLLCFPCMIIIRLALNDGIYIVVRCVTQVKR